MGKHRVETTSSFSPILASLQFGYLHQPQVVLPGHKTPTRAASGKIFPRAALLRRNQRRMSIDGMHQKNIAAASKRPSAAISLSMTIHPPQKCFPSTYCLDIHRSRLQSRILKICGQASPPTPPPPVRLHIAAGAICNLHSICVPHRTIRTLTRLASHRQFR
jgi:hypothetical protein